MSQITPNLIKTWTDIRNNPEHWNQKFSLIFFVDKNKKPYWTKDYNFIPHYERYNEAVKWIRETDFEEYNCKIGWNANNEILLVTQNFFGPQRLQKEKEQELLGKITKKIHQEINEVDQSLKKGYTSQELIDFRNYKRELEKNLGTKTHEELVAYPFADSLYGEELEQLKSISKGKDTEQKNINYDFSRPDLVILWRKQLYFITSFTYSNNYNLTVEIRAKKCLLFLYYWNWMKGAGVGVIDKAPVIPDKDNRHHYDFCGELGIKKIFMQPVHSYQPKFALFCMMNEGIREITWFKKDNFSAPSDIKLKRVRGNDDIKLVADLQKLGSIGITDLKNPFSLIGKIARFILNNSAYLTIGPDELPNKNDLGAVGEVGGIIGGVTEILSESLTHWHKLESYEEILFKDRKGIINTNLEERFKNQPHLWDHTTFQFYLFNNISMTANGRYLGIKEKDGHWVLPYKLYINFSPGNLMYRWEFNMISVKCEISTEATFTDTSNPMRFLNGIKIEAATLGAGINWNPQAGEVELKHHQGEAPAEQEAQTERMFKNTFRNALDKTIEPAMFNANTRDFHYSLGEFFNRLTDPIFFIRIEHSELLYNRLGWANNKNNLAVNNLPIQWKNLSSYTQGREDKKKLGFWRWREAVLESDNNNFFTNLMRKGYWLTDGKELTNPNFKYEKASDYIALGDNSWDITVAEEHWKETIVKTDEDSIIAEVKREKGNNYHQRGHYFIFYEDGTTDHWLALYPKGDIAKDLPDGHTHKAFILEFDKPVKKMVDIYTCIGCGAQNTPLFDTLHACYRKNDGCNNLETIHKGKPFEPWYSAMCSAVPNNYNLTVNWVAGRLGTKGDVWEKATIEKEGTLFTKAYGFIPDGSTIQWRLSGNYKIIRESYFVEKKTQTQEIDQEMLEQEYEEEEIIEEEVLNEDDLEQETGAGGMGAGLEKEREFEAEQEQEEEDEEEQEEENEDESEQEGEQEDEQESEKEEESEDEGEGEDEDEVEEL